MDDFAHARLAEDEPRNPFDIKVLVFYGLARFRKQIVALGILGAILGLIAGAAQPNVYSVNSKLRYQASARQALSDENAYGIELAEFRGGMSAAIIEELELLKDPVIYERVLDSEGFTAEMILTVADPRAGDGPGSSPVVKFMHSLQAGLIHLKGLDDPCPDGETGDARDAAVKRMLANTTLKDVRRTNLISVTYTDSSPAKAKRIGDEIVKQMRARHLEEFQASKQLVTLQANKAEVIQQLTKDREEWREFKQQCGFWDLDTDFATCQEQIRANETKESDLEQERSRLLGKVRSLQGDLGGASDVENGDPADTSGKRLNSDYVGILEEIRDYENRIRTIDLKLSPGQLSLDNKSRYEATVEKLRIDLEGTPKFSDSTSLMGLNADTNEAVTNTQLLLSEASGELQGVIGQLMVVREQLKDLKQRRRTMEECRVEHERLQTAVNTAKTKLDSITTSERTLSSLAVMDDVDISNLSVFRATRLPKDKDGPQRSKPLMMGLVAGLALGFGLAILRQLLDRKVRYQETIENSLGLRVLCVIPELSSKAGFKGAKGAA